MNFWNNFKEELDRNNIQIKEFCIKNNLNYNSICNAISKDTTPNIELAYKIAQSLKVSVEYLYSGNPYSGLNDDELAMLIFYRKLNKTTKSAIKQLLAALSLEK